jgi:hypothetical protein
MIQDLDILHGFRDFPISRDNPPALVGGYLNDDGSSVIERNIYISVKPINRSGIMVMSLEAFSPYTEYQNLGFGRGGRCEYFLDYEALGQFVSAIEGIIMGEISSVTFNRFLSR